MLRRGCNLVDGSNVLGGLDAGLFSSPTSATHHPLHPLQSNMAATETMMEYLQFTSSAIFAVPPGTQPGEHVGQALFERA
jgi:deferrochelatase/peroxidase EfeB